MYLYFVLRNFPLISLCEHLTIFVATVELNAMSFFFVHDQVGTIGTVQVCLLGHSGLVASAFPPSIEPRSLDIHNSALHLNSQSLVASTLGAADAFWRNSPYIAAALTCGFKASAADCVAQRRQRIEENSSDNDVVESSGNVALAVQSPRRAGGSTCTEIWHSLSMVPCTKEWPKNTSTTIYDHLYPAFLPSLGQVQMSLRS